MAEDRYDAIIVGARCAGSPTAMLLARKGYRVLVVDRATFPSDTISTHLVHPPGVAALQRWGLLDRLVATGCPPIDTYAFDFGPFTISGAPGTADAPVAYCPRRTVLDKLLVDAASEAGAEVREGFTVEEIVIEDGRVTGIRGHGKGGATVTERARGRHRGGRSALDGREGRAARAVQREAAASGGYYTYWSGLPMNGRFETYIRPDRASRRGRRTTTSRSSSRGWPYRGVRGEQEGRRGQLPQDARTRARVRRAAPRRHSARRASSARPCRTTSASPSVPAGRWSATPATTRTSSRRRASTTPSGTPSCAPTALDEAFSGARPFDVAMAGYQTTRDEHVLPMYEFTCQLATLEPPPPEMQQLLGGGARQSGGDGRVRAGQRRRDVAGRVLLRGERRAHLRRRPVTRWLRCERSNSERSEPRNLRCWFRGSGASRHSHLNQRNPRSACPQRAEESPRCLAQAVRAPRSPRSGRRSASASSDGRCRAARPTRAAGRPR